MSEEVEDGAFLDGPLDGGPNRLEKPLQLPSSAAKGRDIADRTHRYFDQTLRIDERLRLLLCLDDRVDHVAAWFLAQVAERMSGVLAADPVVSEIDEHLLNVGSIFQPIVKSARRAKPRGVDA